MVDGDGIYWDGETEIKDGSKGKEGRKEGRREGGKERRRRKEDGRKRVSVRKVIDSN